MDPAELNFMYVFITEWAPKWLFSFFVFVKNFSPLHSSEAFIEAGVLQTVIYNKARCGNVVTVKCFPV